MKELEHFLDTILMIEDNETVREVVTDVLQECGYRVATVTHGEEAITYLATHELPCAILLDLEMPVMNGWEFRTWQQLHALFAKIPVIIMSGACDNQRTYELLRPAAYIDKPIDFDSLLNALQTKTNC
jgi:two-component system, OmpR family, response regulator CpxR